VRPSEIERVADEVSAAHGCRTTPVDVFGIANAEGIELACGDYGPEFSGRIEYHREVDKFLLFYPDPSQNRHPTRVRFSVGHELGHYYLEHHRELLVMGAAHNSTTDFICDEQLEREADQFGAALLIPRFMLKHKLSKRPFMTLAEVLELAQDCDSSATSAALRYGKYTREACVIILSDGRRVLHWVASDEAGAIGLRFPGLKGAVPAASATAQAVTQRNGVCQSAAKAEDWFPGSTSAVSLWEEAFVLGETGRVLTLVSASDS
jgi:hypothetical protein